MLAGLSYSPGAPMQIEHLPLSGFFQTLCGHLLRRWWLTLVLLVTVFFGLQLKKFRFDNSADIWFMAGHPALVAKARFDAVFGNNGFVFLMFTAERTPFTPASLGRMAKLTRTLERRVPYAKRALWLGNAEVIEGREGVIRNFMPELPETEESIVKQLDEVLLESAFVGVLIALDKTVLAMTLELNAYPPKAEDLTLGAGLNSYEGKSGLAVGGAYRPGGVSLTLAGTLTSSPAFRLGIPTAFRSKTRLLNHFGGFLLQRGCPEEQGLVFAARFPNVGNFTVANQAPIPKGSHDLSTG